MRGSWMIRGSRLFPIMGSISLMAVIGCQMGGNKGASTATKEAPAVAIDQRENGAAIQVNHRIRSEPPAARRSFTCEVSGAARGPVGPATPEQRASAIQAAVVDALYKAVVEERLASGLSDKSFSAQISPRLTLNHEGKGKSSTIRLTLLSGGTETIFETRGGILTHAPHDVQIMKRLFEATNGRFTLLSTGWAQSQQVCIAHVGCYDVALAQPALAGEAGRAENDMP